MTPDPPDLMAFARDTFAATVTELAAHGVSVDPAMELRPGEGTLCYYDLKDGNIYVSVPDLGNPIGRVHAIFMRSLLACETSGELVTLLRIFLPFVIAHEVGHHLRHRHGRFGSNLWHEEQVANQLGAAFAKRRLTLAEREFARRVLPRAITNLSAQLEAGGMAVESYHNVVQALNASGQIANSALQQVELLEKAFTVRAEDVLRESGQLSRDLMERLERRSDVIASINETYATDLARYVYYQVVWLHLALGSRENAYVDEFARVHLGLGQDLLPALEVPSSASEEAIRACFQAHLQATQAGRAGAARFFYKRYRSLLLALLRDTQQQGPAADTLRRETGRVLEDWEEDADVLVYLSPLVPPELRVLLPHLMSDSVDGDSPLDRLPSETDRRLFAHAVAGVEDSAASATLLRLSLLDSAEVFRALPAEVMLDLAHTLVRVRVREGEMLIREGEVNDDVYILVEGVMDVLVGERRVGSAQSGESFGESAFFTREPRMASVRASVPSVCFVLKHSDLRLLGFRHPSILIQMAGALARRLSRVQRSAQEH